MKLTMSKTRDNKLSDFATVLKRIGYAARPYDKRNFELLYDAAQVLHAHLCKLDNKNIKAAQTVSVIDMANAWAMTDGSGKRFLSEGQSLNVLFGGDN